VLRADDPLTTTEGWWRFAEHQPQPPERSGGMIGSLSQLIRGAAILAIEDGTERITRDLLDVVLVDSAAERASTTRSPARRAASQEAG
jgi:hypothetical protein